MPSKRTFGSADRFRQVLGWQPEIGLEEGIKKVYGEMVDGE